MWRRREELDDSQNDSDDTRIEEMGQVRKYGFLDRLNHFTWANYTFPMSTGGISLLLAETTQPFNFPGLQTIGTIVYIFDLVVFTLTTLAMVTRFLRAPGLFKESISHPTEGLFMPTAQLSMASIIVGIVRYGIPRCGPWLVVAFRVLFWIYFAVGFLIAVGQYTMLFNSPKFKIADMTLAWILPMFPFMLSGTLASAGAGTQPPEHAIPMIIAGLTAQGLGMMVSMCMYAVYFRRLLEFGFPLIQARPGMFIAVGPPAFTALALIGMAKNFPEDSDIWGAGAVTIQILKVMAIMTGIFIWSLSLWFWCFSTLACLMVWRELRYSLGWWAFVFPNVGFTLATISIGESLQSAAVNWVGVMMTLMVIMMWIFVFVHHVQSLLKPSVCVAGKDVKRHDEKNHELTTTGKVAKELDLERQS